LSTKLAGATDAAQSSSIQQEIAKATSAAAAASSGVVQATESSKQAGAMPTAAVALGALMGGAALMVNM